MHFSRQLNCWSLRCSWSIACRRCSNYIFILHLTLGFNILRKDNCRPRRETFKFWDLVRLILEILRYTTFQWQVQAMERWAMELPLWIFQEHDPLLLCLTVTVCWSFCDMWFSRIWPNMAKLLNNLQYQKDDTAEMKKCECKIHNIVFMKSMCS